MKKIALAEVKDHLSECLRDAATEAIVITRHGKAVGVLIGFASEDDWFDYRLENDPAFLARIQKARTDIRAGKGVNWDNVDDSGEFRAADRPRTAHPGRVRVARRNRA
jgi:prevent-host-death family protein